MRALRFTFSDGAFKDLPLKKYTAIRGDVKKVMMHLDQLPDDSYLLIVNEKLIPDLETLKSITLEKIKD